MLIYIIDGSLPSNHEALMTDEAIDELTSGAVYAIAVLGCLEAVKKLLVVNLLPLLLYLLRVLLLIVELFKLCTFGKISVSL
jgi:hypothetical protein